MNFTLLAASFSCICLNTLGHFVGVVNDLGIILILSVLTCNLIKLIQSLLVISCLEQPLGLIWFGSKTITVFCEHSA